MRWTHERKLKLVNIVLDKLKETGKLVDAFEFAAKEFNINSQAVAMKWYQSVKHEFSDLLTERGYLPKFPDRIRKNWKTEEDLKFIEIIVKKYGNREEKMDDAINEIAKELNRPYSSCSFRWYSHIVHKYKDYLNENNFEFRNWTYEEDELLFDCFKTHVGSGKSMSQIAEKAASILIRDASSCKARWDNHEFRKKMASRFEELSLGSWKNFEKELLISEMKLVFENKEPMIKGIFEVSNKLFRNPWSVTMLWYDLRKQRKELQSIDFKSYDTVNYIKWPKDLEDKLIDVINNFKDQGKRATEAAVLASIELNKPFAECAYLYHRILRKRKLKERKAV